MRKYRTKSVLCLLLLFAVLLSACGNAPEKLPEEQPTEPAAAETTPAPEEPAAAEETPAPGVTPAAEEPAAPEEPPILLPEDYVRVSTVDELLAAIASDTTVVLAPGVYDLSAASDYGRTEGDKPYRWDDAYEGWALVLENLEGLRLLAPEGAEITALSRYASVLTLFRCSDVELAGLTLGHSEAPGICSGGVLFVGDSRRVKVRSCKLYGCGTEGVGASNTDGLTVSYSQIYDCSLWGASAFNCSGVLLEDCWIHDCGKGEGGAAYSLLSTDSCRDFAVVNTRITDNAAMNLLENNRSDGVCMLGCTVEGNDFFGPLFRLNGQSVLVEDCGFTRHKYENYYEFDDGDLMARNRAGEELLSFDLDRMEQKRAVYQAPASETPAVSAPQSGEPLPAEGTRLVRASTVDELLAAIGSDTTIVLEEGVYDLSTASNYGGLGGDGYIWEQRYDGPSLLIRDVKNLHIRGAGRALTQLLAVPRYASVLSFENCENVEVYGLTAGHTRQEAYCTGNVLDWTGCRNMTVEDCGLFGCGVIGINAESCRHIQVKGSEIYSCSYMAASFYNCTDTRLDDCSIYGCQEGRNYVLVNESWVSVNGESLRDGLYLFDHRELLGREY